MEAFYSIIYLKTNILTDESLAVGLFVGGGEGPFFHLSESRMRLYKDLVHPNTFLAIRRQLRGLKVKVDKHRQTETGLLLFDPEFSAARFDELHKKTNGIILYSAPTTINEWMSDDLFRNLVEQFLLESRKSTIQRSSFYLVWALRRKTMCLDGARMNCQLSEISGKQQAFDLKIELYDEHKNEVFKGINFDLKPVSRNKHLYELNVISNELNTTTIICIHPTPKTKNGKLALEAAKASFPNVRFDVFRNK